MSPAPHVERHIEPRYRPNLHKPDMRLREQLYGSNRVSRLKKRHDATYELVGAIAFLAGVCFGIVIAR